MTTRRKVTRSFAGVASSPFGAFKFRYWRLELECGHLAERRCRYKPDPERSWQIRGYAALHHPKSKELLLPAPKNVICEECS